MTQELGILALMKRGMRVLTANGDDLTDDSDPSRKMMRQIAGAFAEYEKARIVAKLSAARTRKPRETGQKVEGRKSHLEARAEAVALARELRRKPRKGSRRSLREISTELAQRGYLNERGTPFAAQSIASMLVQTRRLFGRFSP